MANLLPSASPKTNITSSASATLEVAGLECVRGHRALFRNLHFRLDGGAMLHIRGENGTGKTSLLRLLCGLSLPEAGEIFWNGAPIRKHRPDYYRALAYLGHRTTLKGELTAVENLDAARALSARPPALSDHATFAALHQLGLDDCRHLPCGILSAGQRQRVALAGMLLRPGGVWILDEPATALDETALGFLEQMLGNQVAAGGMVVFTSHRDFTPDGATPQQINLADFR